MKQSNPEAVTILIVDNDEVDIRAVTRALRKRHIDNPIAVAGNGAEALAMLRGEPTARPVAWPYIVLLDLNMPRMSGIEFLKALRDDPALTGTEVFALSTSDDDRDKVAAYRHQVAGYILKTNAGTDFVDLVTMLGKFVVTVRFPERPQRKAA